ncbi:Berardinelli-Seip congenital lipodystrophy 2 (seipin) [Lunasporangiospora selenospora]|uniref:Berardinelli-Seip congenital lipodystrophy 2 (Seipin) n=1 Tax=Lunasporangiospora selenospora TaxID=979761 RepID=A0A9P6FW26_9FUNG|nr:Berardinelli-Seip congenital lipodystrophy 2 (seipin) [Lunasporangiospora selenospora]
MAKFLRADQAYDISVNLHVPTSEKNVAIGNFMVVVTLMREDGKAVVTSSRPTILTYQSLPLRLMRTAWKAVPLVLEWSKEDQVLKVPLIENFVEDAANPVTRAYVEISTPELQVYRSSIHIDAHFHGLRYFMYYYKLSTALVFMSVFIFWEIVFSVVTWQVLANWFGSDSDALAISQQIQTHSDAPQLQLRSPSSVAEPSTSPRAQTNTGTGIGIGSSLRQPQSQGLGSDIQRQAHKLHATASDSEFEEEEADPRGQGGGRVPFSHNELELDDQDDLSEVEDDHDEQMTPTYRPRSPYRDDSAVVPERMSDPQVLSSPRQTHMQGSQEYRHSPTRMTVTSTTTATSTAQHGAPSRSTGGFTHDDGSSATASSTFRRIGGSGGDVSSVTSIPHSSGTRTPSGPPPPPPPSVHSERSSEFQMSSAPGHEAGRHRRPVVESEYTEEEEEYLKDEEGDDEGDETTGDITFGEDDFSETALLSHPTSPVRSRRSRESGSTDTGAGAPSGRSSARP